MIRRVLAVTVKELLQLKRDWRTLVALLGMPVVLLLIYGFALSFDVQDIRLAVVDRSRTAASRELIQSFLRSGYFVHVATLDDVRQLAARGFDAAITGRALYEGAFTLAEGLAAAG